MPLVWVLIVLVVIFVAETVLTEVEQWGWATFLLLATLVGCHFLTPFDPVAFVKANGSFTAVYVLVYVGVGVAWSFIKWFSYLRNFRDQFREHKENFLKSKGLTGDSVPQDQLQSFKVYVANHTNSWTRGTDSTVIEGLRNLERPRASKNKRRITAWMAYWPCSFIGTFLNDPVRRLFNWIFGQFKALYQRLADWVFRHDSELQ